MRVPSFIKRPFAWMGRRKWYLLGSVGLVVVGVVAAMVLEHQSAQVIGKATQKAAHEFSFTKQTLGDSTATPDSTTSDAPKEADQDNTVPSQDGTAPAPTTPAPATPTPTSGPSDNLKCTNTPPATWQGITPVGPFTTKVGGDSIGLLTMSTVDATKVIWKPSSPSDGSVTVSLSNPHQLEGSSVVTFSLEVAPSASVGSHTVTWRVEDGTRNICETMGVTVVVQEATP